MLRLARLILIVAVTAGVLAAGVAGLSVVGGDMVHRTAVAVEAKLPPLSSRVLSGSTIYDDQGNVLAVEQGPKLSEPVALSQVPKVLINAVLDTEDAHFYTHGGFDIPSTLRAAASNATPGDQFQGGSTIPQQLVKQVYLSSARKLSRKVKEAVLASRLEKLYSKNQILDAYLNTVYLGSGAQGVEAASHVFFDEDVSQLTLPQAALLAGNIQSPSAYDPISNPTAARVRRSQVLARMVKEHSITQAEANAANVSPLPNHTTPLPQPTTSNSNLYVNQVVNELLSAGSPLGKTKQERYNALYEGGLKIYTNYDPTMTAEAEGAVLGDVPPAASAQNLVEALAAIDPATGAVRAIVGGNTQYDLATQGTRQPGSGFKIFTLLAALEQGYSINSAVDATAPCAVAFPPSATGTSTGDYDLLTHPATNDEGPGSGGETTIANATAQSYNCAFIRIAHEIKLTSVISMARQLGITGPLPAVPAMVLGSQPASPLEMAAAYAAVADNGVYHAPLFINHIVGPLGNTIYNGLNPGVQVVSPEIAAQATTAFRDVVTDGTGAQYANVPGHEVAGKTGTASGPVDAWFDGFTPQLAVSVWMGNPKGEIAMTDVPPYGEIYGGTVPAKTFRDFMASALQGQPNAPLDLLSAGQIPSGKPVASASLSRDDKLHPAPPPAPVAASPGSGGGYHAADVDHTGDHGSHHPCGHDPGDGAARHYPAGDGATSHLMADPAMEALLALQDIDLTLDRLRHRRQTLPARAELEEIAARGARLAGERAPVATERDGLAAREQALEDEMRASDNRASEVERRLYSGEVSASRELTAMAEDVAALRARSSELEDRALEVLTEREPLDARVAAFDAELGDLETAAAKARAELAGAEADVDAELAEVGGRRAQAAAAVPAGLADEYDRLRARLGGVAVARLVGSHCDGCHLTLPATELDRLRRQPPEAVVNCDNCGRILIRS